MTVAESPSPEIPDVPHDVNWLSYILQEIRAIHARFDRMEDRFERMNDRIDRMNERLETQFRWLVGLIVVSWMSLAGLLFPPMFQLQSASAQLQSSVATLQAAVGGLQSQTADLQSQTADLQSQTADLQSQTAELRSQGARTEQAIAELRSIVEQSLK